MSASLGREDKRDGPIALENRCAREEVLNATYRC